MPTTELELIADHDCWSIGNLVDQLAELYRDEPEARSTIIANADMLEETYRRFGNLVQLIRPKEIAA